jgi:hypothetical protein
MKIVKGDSNRIQLPNEQTIIKVCVMNTGKVEVTAPNIHPKDICKILNNIVFDILCESFKKADHSNIEAVSSANNILN